MFENKNEVKKFCHSLRCCGPRGIKVEKSVGRNVLECPNCNHALITVVGNRPFKITKKPKQLQEHLRYLPEGA